MVKASDTSKRGVRQKPRQAIDIAKLIADAQRAYDALVARRERAELRTANGRHDR